MAKNEHAWLSKQRNIQIKKSEAGKFYNDGYFWTVNGEAGHISRKQRRHNEEELLAQTDYKGRPKFKKNQFNKIVQVNYYDAISFEDFYREETGMPALTEKEKKSMIGNEDTLFVFDNW